MNFFMPRQPSAVVKIPVAQIAPNPAQPRRSFDGDGIASLAESIRENGLLQPITVRRTGGGYELIAGERRLLAHKLLGREEISAIVVTASDRESAVLALTENLQRSDLPIFDEAEGIAALLTVWGVPQDEAAKKLGCAPSTLSNKLRLLRLPQDLRRLITESGLTERHARALLRLPTDDARRTAAAKMAREGMNVSAAEKYVDSLLSPPQKKRPLHRVLVVRDLRLFLNTIDRAVTAMKSAGIDAASSVSETDGYLEYVVRVPREQAVRASKC